MHRLMLSTFFSIFLLNKTAIASPTALTPSLILHSFPLCNISSSFGQKCKSLSDNERVNFVPSNITNAAPDFINEERLEIVTEDWNYSFILEKAHNNTATVEFIDDAKFATYFAAMKYYLENTFDQYTFQAQD